MARKKRRRAGERSKRRPPQQPASPSGAPPAERLWGEPNTSQLTPLDRAHEILLHACQEPDEERRLQLARTALEICPDCADAYGLLAAHARTCWRALELHQQGLAAAERALGANLFQQRAGRFWSVPATRPYMRARLGLAQALWTAVRREEAIAHLQEMLRLNPRDHQGVRYTLARFLLFLDRDADLAELLQAFAAEESTAWMYTRALLAFRQQGDTIAARRVLKQARKMNRHVPNALLGLQPLSPGRPGSANPGDISEAHAYVESFRASWKATPGALSWLRANVKPKEEKVAPQPKGPLGFIKMWLQERLPQHSAVWQADLRQMPSWILMGGEPVRPWVFLVVSRSTELVLVCEMLTDIPSAAQMWDALVKAMQHPLGGAPHRPTGLQVRAAGHWAALQPHLEEIGVELVVTAELDLLAEVFNHVTASAGGKPVAGLLEMPGIRPEQVGGFYQAAAAFFQQAPWKQVGYEAPIQVECSRFQSGPWYAVVMGQSGLALSEDLESLQEMWAESSNEDAVRELVGTSVLFGEEWELPVADVEAARQYGWPVARPDAYPEIFHKDRGLALRPPLAWELELMEACLRAMPDFVQRRRQNDPTREEFTVSVAGGRVTLALSWVVEEEEGWIEEVKT